MEESLKVVGQIGGALKLFSDGSHVRLPHPTTPASPQFTDGVASKDVVINPETGVWARIFCPETSDVKPPVLFYFHGGGFSVCSTAWPEFHVFLNRLCKTAGVVIVSVDYRLAPEHRLPAAYDDCAEAVKWAPRSGDEWLSPSTVDFSRCFLGGESAGGNIVHHVAMRFAATEDIAPLRVRGVVVIHPFFGGEEMVGLESGVEGEQKERLRRFCEMVWRMCLPVGSTREHPYCNPLTVPLEAEVELPPVMVAVAGKDFLRRRGVMYYEYLRRWGKEAEVVEEEDGVHAYHVAHPEIEATGRLIDHICGFIKRLSVL